MQRTARTERRLTRRAALASAVVLGLGAVATPRMAAAGFAPEVEPHRARQQAPYRICAFTKTTEYRHDSIPEAVTALQALGAEHGFVVDHTEDASMFADSRLASYRAVVFLLTTG